MRNVWVGWILINDSYRALSELFPLYLLFFPQYTTDAICYKIFIKEKWGLFSGQLGKLNKNIKIWGIKITIQSNVFTAAVKIEKRNLMKTKLTSEY